MSKFNQLVATLNEKATETMSKPFSGDYNDAIMGALAKVDMNAWIDLCHTHADPSIASGSIDRFWQALSLHCEFGGDAIQSYLDTVVLSPGE